MKYQARTGGRYFGDVNGALQTHRHQPPDFLPLDAQWKLYCLVRNIKKLAHQGYAQ
jgi:hypothetical protein